MCDDNSGFLWFGAGMLAGHLLTKQGNNSSYSLGPVAGTFLTLWALCLFGGLGAIINDAEHPLLNIVAFFGILPFLVALWAIGIAVLVVPSIAVGSIHSIIGPFLGLAVAAFIGFGFWFEFAWEGVGGTWQFVLLGWASLFEWLGAFWGAVVTCVIFAGWFGIYKIATIEIPAYPLPASDQPREVKETEEI